MWMPSNSGMFNPLWAMTNLPDVLRSESAREPCQASPKRRSVDPSVPQSPGSDGCPNRRSRHLSDASGLLLTLSSHVLANLGL
jgi:hypothetical protein